MSAAGSSGQVLAAAVLSYVEAALLLLTGSAMFSGRSVELYWSANHYGYDHGWAARFAFAGLGDIVAAAMLIAGGIALTCRRRVGRTLIILGLALCVIEAIFWIIRLQDGFGIVFTFAMAYLAMPIIAASTSFSGSVSRWLAVRS